MLSEFPVLKEYIYADTATTGPMYQSLLQWRTAQDKDYLESGSVMKMQSFSLMEETRLYLGKFFSCQAESITLIPNYSLGLNLFLEGLSPDRRAVLLHGDYPSVNWPFERRGFNTTYVQADDQLETRIEKAVCASRADILALSLVQWTDGLMVDLDFLAELKKKNPGLLIIADGTQFCGTRPFNFSESGIDVLGCSGYKWLLGGFGNAFMLFSDLAKEVCKPLATGCYGAGGDPRGQDDIPFNKLFEPGHLDSHNFGSLGFSLRKLTDYGMEAIGKANSRLSASARSIFGEAGLLQPYVRNRVKHGNIFNITGDQRLHSYLNENKVICALRGKGIRLSFHFYNSEDQIMQIAKLVKSIPPR